jgi:HSP20 family protein
MARNPLTPFHSGGGLFSGDPFLTLHREMNRLFDDVMRGGFGGPAEGGQQGGTMLVPQVNVSETSKEVCITAELPGVSEKDIDVTLDDDVVTLRAEKKFERREEKENFHFVERSFGTFQRSLRLPFPLDPEQVQARFENGVLTVTLPKTQAPERSRKIQIQGGQQGGSGAQGKSQAAGGQSPKVG